jgi:hypothetical protein
MKRLVWIVALAATATLGVVGVARAQTPASGDAAPSWKAPESDAIRAAVFAFLEGRKVDASVRQTAEALWPKDKRLSGVDLLDRTVRSLALGDAEARKLVELCAKPKASPVAPAAPWLDDPGLPPLLTKNLRLWLARWMVQERLYDEALQHLTKLRPNEVVDPATLLFHQGVVFHRLLMSDAGRETLDKLLEPAAKNPRRYAEIAKLMRTDIEGLKEDSLDHIARRMEDIQRRLELSRAGPKVREVEDGVIKSLDKLIKEIEDKQDEDDAAAGAGNTLQPKSPARDSMPMGGKAPGIVKKRDVGNKSGWGNLPPKEREEAIQQIGRDFPSHYRDVIEQYFRKLAAEGSE